MGMAPSSRLSDQRIRVRRAQSRDVGQAELHVEGYEDVYRGLVPDAVRDERPLELRRRVRRERLSALDPSGCIGTDAASSTTIVGGRTGTR
jgi:hypothetical protein